MENPELREAARAACGCVLGLVATACGLVWLIQLDNKLAAAHQEDQYEILIIAAAISMVVLFFATLYTLMKAAIQATHAAAPPGRVKAYLAKQIELAGPLSVTLDYWRRLANGSLVVEVIKEVGAVVLGLALIGVVCAGLFGAWHVVASWPTWAIVIVVLLVLNLGGKSNR